MKQITIFIGIFVLVASIFNTCTQQPSLPILKGPYLGQRPPGMVPDIFAPGIISTDTYHETGCTFSLNRKEFYFTRSGGDLKTPTIYECRLQDDYWTKPHQVSFEGFGPQISPNGKIMMFSKYGTTEDNQRTVELWRMTLIQNKWTDPQYIGLGSRPTISQSGAIYYIDRSNKEDRGAIATQKYVSGEYQESELLHGSVNSPYYEAHPCIAKDESFLIFDSNRPGGYGEGDLYVCYHNNDGSWGNAINLGKNINSRGWDGYASISPDGEYLFYSSDKSGNYQIYWVSIKIIEKLSQ